MSGAETSKATTTVMVVDRVDLSFGTYLAAIRASVVGDGWELNDEMERELWRDARDLADVARKSAPQASDLAFCRSSTLLRPPSCHTRATSSRNALST
jgi:hypothetical protein